MKVDVSQWEEFTITSIFRPVNTHCILKRNIEPGSGPYPYVTASRMNNGVETYISYDSSQMEPGNAILIGGKTMAVTFQELPFFSNDSHNIALYLLNTEYADNPYVLRYLVSIIYGCLGHKYQWSDSISGAAILNDKIKLPVISSGNPDWEYMAQYAMQVEHSAKKHISILRHIKDKQIKIDTSSWKDFFAGDIFDIQKGKRLTSASREDGQTPYIGALNHDNGLFQYIGQQPIFHGNSITVNYNSSAIGYAYYQPNDFWATDDVNVWYFRESNHHEFNKYIALFICPIIKAIGSSYVYTDKWKIGDMRRCKLRLPVTSDGTPDWEYMERYMKNVEDKARENLSHLSVLNTKLD